MNLIISPLAIFTAWGIGWNRTRKYETPPSFCAAGTPRGIAIGRPLIQATAGSRQPETAPKANATLQSGWLYPAGLSLNPTRTSASSRRFAGFSYHDNDCAQIAFQNHGSFIWLFRWYNVRLLLLHRSSSSILSFSFFLYFFFLHLLRRFNIKGRNIYYSRS